MLIVCVRVQASVHKGFCQEVGFGQKVCPCQMSFRFSSWGPASRVAVRGNELRSSKMAHCASKPGLGALLSGGSLETAAGYAAAAAVSAISLPSIAYIAVPRVHADARSRSPVLAPSKPEMRDVSVVGVSDPVLQELCCCMIAAHST